LEGNKTNSNLRSAGTLGEKESTIAASVRTEKIAHPAATQQVKETVFDYDFGGGGTSSEKGASSGAQVKEEDHRTTTRVTPSSI